MNAPNPIDLRSDTVTRPTPAMRDAMHAAPVGDDVFGDDPTINALQERAAELLGKERALFVPSGTMANQLAIRAQTRHGDEIVLHDKAHIYNYEGGAAAALAGVSMRTFDTSDGSLPTGIRAHLHLNDDPHFAPTSLVCFENTNNGCGGVIVPQDNVEAVAAAARAAADEAGKPMRLHLDGARLFNAAVGAGTDVRTLAAPFDTVSVCLSKGLGAPVGSLLAGDAATIARAYRFRKMYGGGMRQAGVLAAAGLHALEHHVDRLADDHARARKLALALSEIDGVTVDLDRAQTNLVYFDLDGEHPLASWYSGDTPMVVQRLAERGVLVVGSPARLRAVTHLDIDDAALDRAITVFREVLGAG